MEATIKIEASNCSNFNNAMHAQFHNQMYALVSTTDKIKINLTAALLAEWKGHIDTETDINREVQKSADTALMADKDTTRDSLVTYLFQFIRNESNSPLPRSPKKPRGSILIFMWQLTTNAGI